MVTNKSIALENVMKKFILLIATIAFFICPSICFSSYLIELNNGSTFITNHHWREGRQIKFYYYGGVVGIEKEFVREIRESDLPYREEVVEQKVSPVPDTLDVASSEAGKKADEEIEAAKKTEARSREIDVAYYKREKKALMEKYRQARDRLEDARNSRNKAAIKDVKKEIKKINNQLTDLILKLKEESNGMLPIWWVKEE
jgi:hypothetical protein